MAYKTFVNGFPLNASELNNYLMSQSVATFADATARSTAIDSPHEGQLTYLESDATYYKYDGADWVALIPETFPAGGDAGQALIKASATDYDADWAQVSQAISPNYIINGAFDIWQRGTSFVTLTDDTFTADRWNTDVSGGAGTLSEEIKQVAFSVNDLEALGYGEGQYFLRWETTDSGDRSRRDLRQKIEDVRTLAGQTVTLSYYAKADSAVTITTRVRQEFNSSTGFSYSTTQELSTSWQRYTQTVTLGDLSGKTLGATNWLAVVFDIPSGASVIDIWGVQLEAGSVATPFRRNANSLQGELAACQRYYYTLLSGSNLSLGFGAYYTTTNLGVHVSFPVTMRTTPSLDATSGSAYYSVAGGGTWDSFTISRPTTTNTQLLSSTVSVAETAGETFRVISNNGSAKLSFSAEL